MLEDNYVGVPVWEISGRESMFPLRESDMPYFFGGLILVASVCSYIADRLDRRKQRIFPRVNVGT